MGERKADGSYEPCIWSSPVGGCLLPIGKHIFCNRSLNMKNIVAVGFDMDYTLAQYKPETFEALAYEGTVKKLVHDLGYPSEMDRHKYVKVAYHGFREMSKDEKVGTYGNTLIRDSLDEPDYALIDTLFSLAEAYLFAQLVDFIDNNPRKVPAGTDYARMYKDVRAAVDLCHRDGTLKRMVAKDPSSSQSTSYQLASKLIQSCAERMKPAICGFLTSCMLERDSTQSDLRGSYHDIVYGIYCAAPDMLVAIIPHIIEELMIDQVDEIIKALNLLGKLLAHPRFYDKVAEVRLSALRCVRACCTCH